MTALNLLKRGSQVLIGAVLLISIFLVNTENAEAQSARPHIPVLSLTGTDGSYDNNWFPDGRIFIPPSYQKPREILVPVFIDNRWMETDHPYYKADPIYSFSFKVLYDSSSLRAVGVQKFHPITEEYYDTYGDDRFFEWYEPFAQRFNISWHDAPDFDYRVFMLGDDAQRQDRERGRAIHITGTSSQPLPTAEDPANADFRVLLYIKFRVVPTTQSGSLTANISPIIIKNDTIQYNNLNVCQEAAFSELRGYPEYPNVENDYPDPTKLTGLEGFTNEDIENAWRSEPTLPGVIYCRIMDAMPDFDFEISRGIGSQPPLIKEDEDTWIMVDPITVDAGSFDPLYGTRVFQILNSTSRTRMVDVEIESNHPWLRFRTVIMGAQSMTPNPIPSITNYGKIDILDNGILGNSSEPDPRERETQDDGEVHLEVVCDPSQLDMDDPPNTETAGIYVGYITMKSPYAAVSPVRIKITFIYFRVPDEGIRAGADPGIGLTVANSKGTSGEVLNLIFGTGYRASDKIDTLFGEYAYEFPMSGFDARFFPPGWDDQDNPNAPLGLGDFAANDEQRRSNSRDIRSNEAKAQSHIYNVKFVTDGDDNYPIVVSWDTRDFPDGADLFLRDAFHGQYFPSINMREATMTGQYTRSFSIQDPRVKEFIIEYTLPDSYEFVDEFGDPIIKKGWNLLSLGRKATNPHYENIFPNAINIPYFFSQNQYQSPTDGELNEGIGYFVKYSNEVDKTFRGTFISEISVDRLNAPRLYPGDADRGGWSTIGGLSVPINVEDIEFTNFGSESPQKSYTKAAGVWGYVTNRGYKEISILEPGLGYWLKVDQNGYLKLQAERMGGNAIINPFKHNVLSSSVKLYVKDNGSNEGLVYLNDNKSLETTSFELPPLPPFGIFDIRFADNKIVSTDDASIVRLQGVEYPISISMENVDADYTLYDAVTGEELGSISPNSNTVDIRTETSNAIKVVKTETTTFDFNASVVYTANNGVKVKYTVPESNNVRIVLFDALGNAVSNLVDNSHNAGEYEVNINTNEIVSGHYYVNVITSNYNEVLKVVVVK